ncbi:MAG: type II toxin-antitoxin system prevent-host-death family antitoxin [Promicromonosporaceae bacterium]|nr:type II toxin-antitoxin system prevent-host-death family antitoxin [Promicromonosporaceae bacterium]
MEVAVSALRAELKTWIEKARTGEEVIITDRGLPVARLSGIGAADLVQGLVRDGLLTPAQAVRPVHEVAEPAATASTSPFSGLVRRIRR